MKPVFFLFALFFASQASADVEEYGNFFHLMLPATAAGMSYYMEDDFEGFFQLAKAGVTSRATVEVVKALVSKNRPDESDDDSFPSGHTADSFAAATFISQRYGANWGLPAYLTAAYVGYTRMEEDKHYFDDVVIGGLIGVLSSLYFVDPYVKDLDVKVGAFSNEEFGRGITIAATF